MWSKIRGYVLALTVVLLLATAFPVFAGGSHPGYAHHGCPAIASLHTMNSGWKHRVSQITSQWWPVAQWDNIHDIYSWYAPPSQFRYNHSHTQTCW